MQITLDLTKFYTSASHLSVVHLTPRIQPLTRSDLFYCCCTSSSSLTVLFWQHIKGFTFFRLVSKTKGAVGVFLSSEMTGRTEHLRGENAQQHGEVEWRAVLRVMWERQQSNYGPTKDRTGRGSGEEKGDERSWGARRGVGGVATCWSLHHTMAVN